MKTSITQIWMVCHLLPFAKVGQHCLDCLRNAHCIRIAVADGVVYSGTRGQICGLSRCVEYRDSWITSAVGGLAFSEISGDKKGPECGLIRSKQF